MAEHKYEQRYDGKDPIECDRCGSQAPTVETDWDDIGRRERVSKNRKPKERLCKFCYETHLGIILDGRGRADLDMLARGLAQAFNLLDAK